MVLDKVYEAAIRIDEKLNKLKAVFGTVAKLRELNDAIARFIERVNSDAELRESLLTALKLVEIVVNDSNLRQDLADMQFEVIAPKNKDFCTGSDLVALFEKISDFVFPVHGELKIVRLGDVRCFTQNYYLLAQLENLLSVEPIRRWCRKLAHAYYLLEAYPQRPGVTESFKAPFAVPASETLDLRARCTSHPKAHLVLVLGTLNLILNLDTLAELANAAIKKLNAAQILDKVKATTSEMTKLT